MNYLKDKLNSIKIKARESTSIPLEEALKVLPSHNLGFYDLKTKQKFKAKIVNTTGIDHRIDLLFMSDVELDGRSHSNLRPTTIPQVIGKGTYRVDDYDVTWFLFKLDDN